MLNTGSASTLVKTQPFLYENMSKFALIQFCSIVFPSTAMFSYSNVTDIMQFIEPHEFLQSYLYNFISYQTVLKGRYRITNSLLLSQCQ